MGRVLFVVPPLTGHVNPAVGIAGELACRGHEVAVAGHASVVGALVPDQVPLVGLPERVTPQERAELEARARNLRGPASLKFLWEDFLIPLGREMAAELGPVLDQVRPDLVVVDQQAIGAALLARRRGQRWATLATTSAEFDEPFAMMAGVERWVRDLLDRFEAEMGVPPPERAAASGADLRFSETLTMVCSVPGLLRTPPEQRRLPPGTIFIGSPAGLRRLPATDFPWDWLDADRARLLVSLGTVTREAGSRFLRAAAEGVLTLADRLQTVLVAPPGVADDLAAAAPADLLVRPMVPQLELLRRGRLEAIVSHAGNNTVCEALSHGVPLVVAPIRDDQPIIAEQVVRAGAGLRVKFGRVNAAGIAAAVTTVLDEPGYRAAAQRLRAEFAAAGGAAGAADHIEKLLA
ncbi:MAG: glycosyltransferase family 1 protein [Frankia sp.]|nr:glycosyltransferase family 1 protein [Frankia sp.]